MATINYARMWQRILERLEWLLIRLNKQYGLAETDEERSAIRTKQEQVQAQINAARIEVERLKARYRSARYVK